MVINHVEEGIASKEEIFRIVERQNCN